MVEIIAFEPILESAMKYSTLNREDERVPFPQFNRRVKKISFCLDAWNVL
jgi:hypothetical protein